MKENHSEDIHSVNFYFLMKIISKNLRFIVLFSIVSLIVGFSVSLFIQNTYQSSSLIKLKILPERDGVSLPQGTAGLLGGFLNSNQESNNFKHIIVSRDFFHEIYKEPSFLSQLEAIEDYDPSNGRLIYKESIYDPEKSEWLLEKPSLLDSHRNFLENHLFYEAQEDNILEVSIKHASPYVAESWMNLILTKVDQYQRKKDEKQLLTSIAFLKEEYSKSPFSEIRNSLTSVIGKKYEDLALINSSDYYSFEIIDSPFFPISIHSPNRILISILGLFLGFFFSIFFILFLVVIRPENHEPRTFKFIVSK